MADNPYDQVAYRTFPRRQTHPDRLAAIARYFGMHPSPPGACRVLEIGCGNGGNLIPLAYYLPRSRFTGIDLAAAPVAEARAMAGDLALSNIELRAGDFARCLVARQPRATWCGCWMARAHTRKSHTSWRRWRGHRAWKRSAAICPTVSTGWRGWRCWKGEAATIPDLQSRPDSFHSLLRRDYRMHLKIHQVVPVRHP